MFSPQQYNWFACCIVATVSLLMTAVRPEAAEKDDEPDPADLAVKPIPELLALCHDWSPVTRVHVARALADRGKDSIQGALKLLADASPFARRAGTDIITEMCRPARAARLYPDLKKSEALDEIRRVLGGPVVAPLMPLLSDTNMWVRCGAAEALAALGPESKAAAPALFKALNDSDNWVIERAATALEAAGMDGLDRKQLLPELMKMLKSPRSRTRSAAVKMLDRIGDDARITVPQLAESVRARSTDSMFSDGPRLEACRLLAKLKAREAVACCLFLVEEDRWGAAHRAAQAMNVLSSMGPAAVEALPSLERIAASPKNAEIGREAGRAIAAIRGASKKP